MFERYIEEYEIIIFFFIPFSFEMVGNNNTYTYVPGSPKYLGEIPTRSNDAVVFSPN